MNCLEGETVKFDVVVGNPPYQENDNGKREDGAANASASPLYHYFFNLAKKISNDKVNLIFPARWLTGAGKGLGDFSNEMLLDTHIRSMTIFKDSSKVFPNTDIKGGVLYLTYESSYDGEANVIVVDNDETQYEFKSYLNSVNTGVFIPYGEMVSIYEKVANTGDLTSKNIQKIASVRKPYGLSTDFFKNPSKYGLPAVFAVRRAADDIEIIGLVKNKRELRYIPKDYPIPTGKETVYKWKVFAGKAMGAGIFGEKVPDIPIGYPGQIATETFIRLGEFDTMFEAEALQKYYYTKFFRAMLGILKTTQDAPSRVYSFIPLQDFTPNSDIDWEQSISEIDQQLYKKYGLSEEEIRFIEHKVKAMD